MNDTPMTPTPLSHNILPLAAWWQGLPRRARTGLAAGAALIALLTALAGAWLLRTEEAVLFSELQPQDAALIAAELDKLKLPYAIGDNGTSLRVDAAQVHAIRLKLMGRDLPLRGAVGLELFNNGDFGMTEFTQKINFQRALQGELTRTIVSLREVRDVRVHLALPEQGLFRPAGARPTAAITLAMHPGQALRAEQVSGIQRLVAAAVPGLAASEVTVINSDGVALSRSATPQGEAGEEPTRAGIAASPAPPASPDSARAAAASTPALSARREPAEPAGLSVVRALTAVLLAALTAAATWAWHARRRAAAAPEPPGTLGSAQADALAQALAREPAALRARVLATDPQPSAPALDAALRQALRQRLQTPPAPPAPPGPAAAAPLRSWRGRWARARGDQP